jgi:ribosomal protein S18 acetylase RimI-like enzyme
VVERAPTEHEYVDLRAHVGWGQVSDLEAVARALEGSLYSVCIEFDGRAVATGRLVGDGGVYAYIQDVILLEEFRGRGLAVMVMDALMAHLDRVYPDGAFIGLMAAEGVAGLYERYGFERRPENAPGMRRVL